MNFSGYVIVISQSGLTLHVLYLQELFS